MKRIIILTIVVMFALFSCKSGTKSSSTSNKTSEVKKTSQKVKVLQRNNTLSELEKKEGWLLLFDGKTSKGWRGYKKEHFPKAWEIIDGTIHIKGSGRGEAGSKDGGDIIYDKEFQNFHLKLEWKVSKGGNSGIFYLGKEKLDYIWETAPEMQILDNVGHPDAKLGIEGNRQAGSLYDLVAAVPQNAKPVGEWNKIEIICYKGTVIHKQNGVSVVEYHLWTPKWNEMVKNSKFPSLNEDWADVANKGYFGVQDHGDDVWFRNIRIKEL